MDKPTGIAENRRFNNDAGDIKGKNKEKKERWERNTQDNDE